MTKLLFCEKYISVFTCKQEYSEVKGAASFYGGNSIEIVD
jgi:hypothetical protein